ncbi:MAG: RNA polymerase sigma factor [Candidatus Kapaibacterium sp.]|jgi:RNA polymerase sigma factor (sigma-70 family)|nr:sigma-70 family RNA polymerase sigma factor [Candidatus Kapabacteria bacterium]
MLFQKSNTTHSSKTDEELMQLLRQGNHEVMVLIMRRYKQRIITFIFRFIGSYEVAIDLTQDVFVRVFRSRDTFSGNDKFSNWIFTIAANVARSEYKSMHNQVTVSLNTIHLDSSEDSMQLADESYMPDESVDTTIIAQQIQKALMTLPPSQRIMIIMRDIQNLSYEEIAIIENIEVGTVKSRINRGRAQLQVMLKHLHDEIIH